MALEVSQLVKHFGGVQALRGVSFRVDAGECVALIGPNGAGKSTTFACIAGQQVPTQGSVRWQGQRLEALSPAERLRCGVARTFQVAQTFEALTALQNVQLALQAGSTSKAWSALDRFAPEQALQLLERVHLQDSAQLRALALPYGAKKRLELAIAMAGIESFKAAQPAGALLLLDEPAAGLAAAERAGLMQLVKSFKDTVAVLYTEHNMDAVFGVADRVIVLIDGEIAAQGSAQEVARDAVVRKRYLGSSVDGFTAGAVHA